MIYFNSDYNEGAHENVLNNLIKSNYTQEYGYGDDKYTKNAIQLLKNHIKNPNVDIHFTISGTPTNVAVISHLLRPYEAVVSSNTGHINVHESGAVESRGHKVISISNLNGKITPKDLDNLVKPITDEIIPHISIPRLVYISIPTELGTMYNKSELELLYKKCKELEMYLYIDGARLGYGLTSKDCDLDLSTISKNCDVFYLGLTKCGALCGEAVIIINDLFKPNFANSLKQSGQLLAKGRLLGAQFEAMFTDNLYFDICKKANYLACKIRDALLDKNIKFLSNSNTNQQFPILPNDFIQKIKIDFKFEHIEDIDAFNTCYRICTSWATKEKDVDLLISTIKKLL